MSRASRPSLLAAAVCAALAGCSWFEVDEDRDAERSDAAPPAASGRLEVPELRAGDQFGTAVAAGPDLIAVGAPGDDREGSEAGAVHLFAPAGSGWSEQLVLVGPEAGTGDRFGSSVALAGDLLAVGAPGRDEDGSWAGAVYVYRRDGDGWNLAATLVAPDPTTGARFGVSVAFLDADRLTIGASGHDGDDYGAGAAYLFERDGDTWSASIE
jgi:ketosteroid isomerase-like protein